MEAVAAAVLFSKEKGEGRGLSASELGRLKSMGTETYPAMSQVES